MGNLQAGSASVIIQVTSMQVPYNSAGTTRIDVKVNQPPLVFSSDVPSTGQGSFYVISRQGCGWQLQTLLASMMRLCI